MTQFCADAPQVGAKKNYPLFSLSRLLKTVFDPKAGQRVAIMIDLYDIEEVVDFAFVGKPNYEIQRHAYESFYLTLKESVLDELNLVGGDLFAYKVTGGSNLDLPDEAMTPEGQRLSLEKDVYPNYDLVLCISTYSATAPLTALAKIHGFRGATLHGLNDIILSTGLCVDYDEVSADAEKLRLGLTKADRFAIDFEYREQKVTLHLLTNEQEAQKSHGLCRGDAPDVANLPAGEVYYVPEGAEGQFFMQFEDGTIGLLNVKDGHVQHAELQQGSQETIDALNARVKEDPATGEIGELGLGTQVLPPSGADIQDEKILGTVHVATGRSDHLGGDLTPDKFENAGNATHDDILFAPFKTPDINVPQVRMYKGGQEFVIIENYEPAAYMLGLLQD